MRTKYGKHVITRRFWATVDLDLYGWGLGFDFILCFAFQTLNSLLRLGPLSIEVGAEFARDEH